MNPRSVKLSLIDPRGDLKVVRRTVQSETVDKLRNAILMGQFKPGTRLAEAMLCELMSVSRTSIREALRRLQGEKIITIIANKGPSVARIEWDDAKAIYEVRALLEGEAAARCASRVTPADILAMQGALRAFNAAIVKDDAPGRVTATNDFYQVIFQSCANSVIGEVLQSLNARINFLRFQSMARPGRSKHSAVEMRRIVTALEKGDAAAARQAAVAHVEAACAAVKVFYRGE
jgi:DNA-binding GntR family transcriptional regulator